MIVSNTDLVCMSKEELNQLQNLILLELLKRKNNGYPILTKKAVLDRDLYFVSDATYDYEDSFITKERLENIFLQYVRGTIVYYWKYENYGGWSFQKNPVEYPGTLGKKIEFIRDKDNFELFLEDIEEL